MLAMETEWESHLRHYVGIVDSELIALAAILFVCNSLPFRDPLKRTCISMSAFNDAHKKNKDRTQRDAHVEALRSDPNDAASWHGLGRAMYAGEIVTVNGKEYTGLQCYAEALRLRM